MTSSKKTTSWHDAGAWYDSIVGPQGHYYHTRIILPNALRLLDLRPNDSVIDIGCGQGVFARALPYPSIQYLGIDVADSLIKKAKELTRRPNTLFLQADATEPFPTKERFSVAVCILALQNIANPALALQNAAKVLRPNGKMLLVLNHPCFRIPRQSSWGFDEATKTQYRKINRYMSPAAIPITTNPGKGSATTMSFHNPLSAYSLWLSQANISITLIEEWCSDKISTGAARSWENRARAEFPLFLTVLGRNNAVRDQ